MPCRVHSEVLFQVKNTQVCRVCKRTCSLHHPRCPTSSSTLFAPSVFPGSLLKRPALHCDKAAICSSRVPPHHPAGHTLHKNLSSACCLRTSLQDTLASHLLYDHCNHFCMCYLHHCPTRALQPSLSPLSLPNFPALHPEHGFS